MFHRGSRKILILVESPAVNSRQYQSADYSLFDDVFTWDKLLLEKNRKFTFFPAYVLPGPRDIRAHSSQIEPIPFNKRLLSCAIWGAKGSLHRSEAYSKRLEVINHAPRLPPDSFHLYGSGWELFGKQIFDLGIWKGKVARKFDVIRDYKFCFCYENTVHYEGYITEKIFDALVNGVVPVYLGNRNTRYYLDSGLFIDASEYDSLEQLFSFLFDFKEETYDKWLIRRDMFLADESSVFSLKSAIRTVTSKISRYSSDSLPEEAATGTVSLRRSPPRLITIVGWGEELPIYKIAKNLWKLYISDKPTVTHFYSHNFTSETTSLAEIDQGEFFFRINPKEFRFGDTVENSDLASTGFLGPVDHLGQIIRQYLIFINLLNSYEGNFFLYQSSVTSVVNFGVLEEIIDRLPEKECFAGMPARMSDTCGDADVAGKLVLCGTNTILSRDMVEFFVKRFNDIPLKWLTYPQDVTTSLIFNATPRICLPFFTFTKALYSNTQKGEALARAMEVGHYHFRFKSTSGPRMPEDIDNMSYVMAELTSRKTEGRLLNRLNIAMNRSFGKNSSSFLKLASEIERSAFFEHRVIPLSLEDLGI